MNVPDSRAYTHHECRTQTEVSGGEFAALSDPLVGMEQTFCASCNDHFPVKEFKWSDTDEKISDYYLRHSKKATEMDRFFCSSPSLIFLAGAGMTLGVMFGAMLYLAMRGNAALILTIVFAVVGAVAGVIIREKLLVPQAMQRVCGVPDSRMLK